MIEVGIIMFVISFIVFSAGVKYGKWLLMKDLEYDGYLVKQTNFGGVKSYEIYAKRGLYYEYIPAKG
jgi:hypothetical protein